MPVCLFPMSNHRNYAYAMQYNESSDINMFMQVKYKNNKVAKTTVFNNNNNNNKRHIQ